MSATVREKDKGSGEFWVFINHGGRRRAKFVGNRGLAEQVAAQINAEIERGTFSLEPIPTATSLPPLATVAEFGPYIINKEYASEAQQPTRERYLEVFERDIRPIFGHRQLGSVKASELWDLINCLVAVGRTTRSSGLTRTVLNIIFKMAKLREFITVNPMEGLPNKKARNDDIVEDSETDDEVNPLTENEMQRFLSAARAYSPTMYYPLFLTGFRTGMRLGEILALRWEHIDWERRTIRVSRSYRKGKLGKTKTRTLRHVDMSDQLEQALRALHAQRQVDDAYRDHEMSPIIFHSKGGHRSQNTTRKAFKTCLTRAGLPERRIHDMRHTYATLLLSKGVDVEYISKQLGHRKISMTLEIYARFIPGSNRQKVNKLDTPPGKENETEP
jgi:integrase